MLSPSPTFLIAAAGKAGPSQLPLPLPLGFQEKQPPVALEFQFTAQSLLPPGTHSLLQALVFEAVVWDKLVTRNRAYCSQQEALGVQSPWGPSPTC